MLKLEYPRRKGLFDFGQEAVVEATLGPHNFNNWGKKQFSAFIRDEFYYLPAHQILTQKLQAIPEGSLVLIKRLNSDGHRKKAFEYDVKTLRRGPASPAQTTLDNF